MALWHRYKTHGLPLPEYIVPFFDQIEDAATKLIRFSFAGQHDEERMVALRLAMGRAINLVLDNIDKAKSGKINTKLYLYSGHDTTVLPMVEVLDIDDKRWPPFAAEIRYELYEDLAGDHWVQVKYLGKMGKAYGDSRMDQLRHVERKVLNFSSSRHWDQPKIVRGCRSAVCPLRDFENAIEPFRIRQKEYESMCASNILEKIQKDILELEVEEVEDAETKEKSDIAARI